MLNELDPLILVEDVTFYHPGVSPATRPALDHISLTIRPGELIALVGANGSGKTTLARHLNGLLLPTSGRVMVAGLDTRQRKSLPAIRATVGIVFQHPEDQIVATLVEEDIAFGPENLGLPSAEIRDRVDQALEITGIQNIRKRPPHLLSAGQMQRVVLAGILAMRPRCIIFDEATAMLDPAGRKTVTRLIQQLHAEGFTVIFITHMMEEAARAERVLVMAEGRLALDATPREIFSDFARLEQFDLEPPTVSRIAQQLKKTIPQLPVDVLTIEELVHHLPHYQGSGRPDGFSSGQSIELDREPLVEVSNLKYTYMPGTPLAHPALNGVNLKAGGAKVHALIGATGSGKSTLLQHFNGLLRAQEGQVRVGRFNLTDRNITVKSVYRTVGLVFQDPDTQIFEQYVGDEIAYGPRMFLPREELRERVRWAMDLVGLDFDQYKDRRTVALSGGERRKVALASVLAIQPEILVLDEPTAGLDPAARRDLRRRLLGLKADQITLLVSSHQMDDVAELADRVTVLQNGQDILTGTPGQIFRQAEDLENAGLGLPDSAFVANHFRALGWPLPVDCFRIENLVGCVEWLQKAGENR